MSSGNESDQRTLKAVKTVETVNVGIESIILQEAKWLAEQLSTNEELNPDEVTVKPSLALRHALAVDTYINDQVRNGNKILIQDASGKVKQLDWKSMAKFFS